ncbi:MAG: hypothetical protein KF896_00860 [Ignavibacteriae bacterium]|nr:hypothetical protein [Ignavibacteriota bacterium]
MTTVRRSDVDNWFWKMVGVSNLVKRRIAFSWKMYNHVGKIFAIFHTIYTYDIEILV